MRHVSQTLQALLEPTIEALGFELLGVLYLKSKSDNIIRLYIDRDDGVGVDDCASISHHVSGILEVESTLKEAYLLEVSSPGLERPLFQIAHFKKFIGHDVKIWLTEKTEGRVRLSGKIKAVDGKDILITDSGNEYCVSLGIIDKAKLAPAL